MTLETQVSENIASFAFATSHSAFKQYMEDNDKAITKPTNQPTSGNSINTPNSPPKLSSTPYSTCKCQQHKFNSMIWHATIIKFLPLDSEFLGVSNRIPL